jgi:hypothetical protein
MPNAKSLKNLNKSRLDKIDKERARVIQSKGGKASKAKQRQLNSFQSMATFMLSSKVTDEKIKTFVKAICPELKDEEITARSAMLARQYEKAIKTGDSKAFEVLRDTAGEKPTEKVDHQGNLDITIKWTNK